jgi:hypothetical protein
MCSEEKTVSDGGLVPHFTVVGFGNTPRAADSFTAAVSALQRVEAMRLSACVGATYSNGKVCFNVPIFGDVCVSVPLSVPVHADLKACVETCGIFPTGVKGTIYLNGTAVWSGRVIGSC